MQSEFEMSMMGELKFFLGLQIKQTKDGIFVNQSKYCKELIHKVDMENVKHMATPMSIACYLDKDETGQSIDVKQLMCHYFLLFLNPFCTILSTD